jgi:hypothetical protein
MSKKQLNLFNKYLLSAIYQMLFQASLNRQVVNMALESTTVVNPFSRRQHFCEIMFS